MALRLQGSLLYGVSRVYDQQCGYTLLDAQMMRDKMVTMLKQLPGGGLDPSAGKTKPTSLILPYDPTFLPETGLPGLDLNFALFDVMSDDSSTQRSGSLTSSPATSQSANSQIGVIQLELPTYDLIREGDVQDLNLADTLTSGKKREFLGKDLNDEGVLLQPDFEFDEDGNIIEFDASHLSPSKRRKVSPEHGVLEGPAGEDVQEGAVDEVPLPMMDDGMEINAQPGPQDPENNNALSPKDRLMEDGEIERTGEVRAQQRIRQVKNIISDDSTTLRNTDLAKWNDEYSANMAHATKLKKQNKLPTLAKKNAAFWVFGLGIGSVGMGLGQRREDGPLKEYSGDALYSLVPGEKHSHRVEPDENDEQQSHGALGHSGQKQTLDVEIGRQAPSSVYDDRSSQMPWNITASLQGSVRGQRFGSISGSSARPRGRLISASPLAGRDRHSSLSIPNVGDDLGELEQLDITQYLEGELAPDNEDISTLTARRKSMIDRITSSLDTESLNFFEFIQMKLDESASTKPGVITFPELLPPTETTRIVAAHGFMNVLTLATKGVLDVSQESCTDLGAGTWGIRFQHGDISLRMTGAGAGAGI
ncbi:Meiotic recombination protein rec8 [Penicillium subrubescens]|uniref:Meiotic recombination protein rec8 n=2 Tax=Penicillium subrubescens TaxID=1316194 RepID=A0A1Q5UM91_9EURO|nr:Meiotic recombination protein rec8 [Penicillium subrubescens]